MLQCADGSYYVGSARYSLDRRVGQHQSGEYSGYTTKRRPVKLVWFADFQSVRDAIAFERQLKGWSRAKKEALIRGDFAEISRLARRRSFETAAARPPQDEGKALTAPVVLVLARAENGVIGANGGLPWRLAGDLPRFKQLTLGRPCIMGRKTWDSLPKKPLPGRCNIVVSRTASFAADGAVVVGSFAAAVACAEATHPDAIMVIGGAEIFAQALPYAAKIELTVVYGTPAGEVVMPPFSPAIWRQTARADAGPTHSYVTLERCPA
jgi:dihydrofolate reductase